MHKIMVTSHYAIKRGKVGWYKKSSESNHRIMPCFIMARTKMRREDTKREDEKISEVKIRK